jgi:proline iminopeptidase
MKKKLLVGLGVVVVALLVAAGALWFLMVQPLYRPGMLRAGPAITRPLQSHDESFWTMGDGVRLYHFGDGAGRNVLVVHGGPGFPFRTPVPGLRPLADRYRFIYYDQRGCGRSSRPIERFSGQNYFQNVKLLNGKLGLGAQVADIERIRRILGDQQLVIVGHSFGALLAALYAAEFPERVKGMVLVGPANLLKMPPDDGGLYERMRARMPAKLKPEYEAYLKRLLDFSGVFSKSDEDLRALNAGFVKYYVAAGGMVPEMPDGSDNGGWMVQGMYFSMGMRHDYRAAMKAVTAPVLVVHGEKDLQPEAWSREFAAAFPKARVTVIRNAGHFVFYDRPDEFAAEVGKFFGEL